MSRRLIASISLAALALTSACLRRDVAAEEPTTKISFETIVPQPAIDKVDLLVMVDNSSSMADKQRILGAAVPDLLRGLVQPKCVDKKTRAPIGTLADPLKPAAEQCPAGSEPAFRPITDMHIGVISSSLGGLGSTTACKPDGEHHNDDQGHLIARGAAAGVAQAGDLHFLAWYPDVEKNEDKIRHPVPPVPATTNLPTLESAFKELVVGVGQDGCGLEAQLESVYRFLVQPDPWTEIEVGSDQRASYGPAERVDGELLRQRAAFLRPDSLVAVIMLTDEDDSSVDPLAFDGSAWRFGDSVNGLPRPTAACATDPASPSCTSCAFAPNDASCAQDRLYDPAQDPLNVRFHAMKRRYGVDPQFPIGRYVDGFSKNKIPRRASEHDRGSYVGKADCTNPLFAARLPSSPNEELCNLPRGSRSKDLVYFAVIGGVPNELLPPPPITRAPLGPVNGLSSAIDWTKIVGRDPSRYDETGIDPHMIASTAPRAGLPPPTAADDADPIHGREWETKGEDLQFACTFDLDAPVKCTGTACDCDGQRTAPLCAATDRDVQLKAKAYPTRRQLTVARELGDHAVVASLCARQLTSPERDDYGYRPAVRAITDRFTDTLTASCVPRPLGRDGSDGAVPCLVLATLAEPGPPASCEALGLAVPRADVVAQLRDRVAAEDGEATRSFPVCEVPQIVVAPGESCRDEDRKQGFCYAENVPGVRCTNSLQFAKRTTELIGARFTMQCITVGATR